MSGSAQGAISGRIPRPRITKVQFPATNVTNGPSIWRWNNSFAANDLYVSGICWHRFHLGATVINYVSLEQIGHLSTTKSDVFKRILTNVCIMTFKQVIECLKLGLNFESLFSFFFLAEIEIGFKRRANYFQSFISFELIQLDTWQQFQPVEMTWFMHQSNKNSL